ncbi:HpcH/HpaI aldolase family protein [Cellulomonas timonensis]|uniref:HpcH/HpaI aldolase family protein n=1 Tax=Cellulomonas timonensis TaxID=1689271 RepID=UPI00082E11AE|nr:aldolase/citrate lyase family protein [Cellulomonas timonensis]
MTPQTASAAFAERMRARETVVGYWSMLGSGVAAERLSRVGYDYVCVDAQHGFGGYNDMLHALTAIDGSPGCVGLVRVPENSATQIGRALDAGAVGVIVPLVDDAASARRAADACRYPPRGNRSYGPIRSTLGAHGATVDRDRDMLCLAMIETAPGLENVEEICQTQGIDGVYVGPSDLSLVLGARYPGDPLTSEVFEGALLRVLAAAADAGVAAGIHCASGEIAARRLQQGFTFASVASDIVHLEAAAAQHLKAARALDAP